MKIDPTFSGSETITEVMDRLHKMVHAKAPGLLRRGGGGMHRCRRYKIIPEEIMDAMFRRYRQGHTSRQIAHEFGVAVSTARRMIVKRLQHETL